MAKNRTMQAKNAKARKESMLMGKGFQFREMAMSKHAGTMKESTRWHMEHIPDYTIRPRMATL